MGYQLIYLTSHQVAYAKYLCGVWDRQGGKQGNVAALFSGDELSKSFQGIRRLEGQYQSESEYYIRSML